MLLSPGFVLSFGTLRWAERSVVVAIVVLWATMHTSFAWIGAILVLFAIYSKEPAFVGFLVFGLLTQTWWLVALSLTYPLAYLLLVLPHRTYGYASSHYRWPLVALKNLSNYAFFSDPLVMLVGVPMALLHPTPYLLAGCAYLAVYLVMNVYTPYYLFPALVWMLPTLSHVTLPWWWVGLVGILWIGNTLPATLHYLTYNLYLPHNFQRTVRFLAEDLSRRRGPISPLNRVPDLARLPDPRRRVC